MAGIRSASATASESSCAPHSIPASRMRARGDDRSRRRSRPCVTGSQSPPSSSSTATGRRSKRMQPVRASCPSRTNTTVCSPRRSIGGRGIASALPLGDRDRHRRVHLGLEQRGRGCRCVQRTFAVRVVGIERPETQSTTPSKMRLGIGDHAHAARGALLDARRDPSRRRRRATQTRSSSPMVNSSTALPPRVLPLHFHARASRCARSPRRRSARAACTPASTASAPPPREEAAPSAARATARPWPSGSCPAAASKSFCDAGVRVEQLLLALEVVLGGGRNRPAPWPDRENALPTSGDSMAASGAPFFTRWPGCASMRTTRPVTGENTCDTRRSSKVTLPLVDHRAADVLIGDRPRPSSLAFLTCCCVSHASPAGGCGWRRRVASAWPPAARGERRTKIATWRLIVTPSRPPLRAG